jgi:hypothetical protein
MTAAPLAPSAKLTVDAAESWTTLGSVPPDGVFDPERVDERLPESTRLWLAHSIAPGTPLAHAASLDMTGEIRLGKWRSFRASQVIAPAKGYVWAASTRFSLFPLAGFDRYSDGAGEMRWRMARLLPFGSQRGDDVTLSAAGRLAAELALLPTAFDVATWAPNGPRSFVARTMIDGHLESVAFHIGGDGRLREVRSNRWGNPLGRRYGRYPFGVICLDEATFGGITIPTAFTAGWFIGTDRWSEGMFYRARITGLSPC